MDLVGMCYSVAAHKNLADAGPRLGIIQHEASFYTQRFSKSARRIRFTLHHFSAVTRRASADTSAGD